MVTLSFPKKKMYKYYEFYVSFIKSIFEVAEENVIIDPELEYIAPAAFFIKINGKLAFVELSDFPDEYNYVLSSSGWSKLNKFYEPEKLNCPVFKRSMRPNLVYSDNTFPFGPFYVANNINCDNLKNLINIGNIYNNNNNLILNTNRVWGGAKFTRGPAFSNIAKRNLHKDVQFDTRRMDLISHYRRHSELLASLNISGAHYHSQDIGAPESMFLGCLVISNDFDIMLPFNKRLIKGEHYIDIKDDYSNITDCLNFPYENRDKANEIAYSGYEVLRNTCSPKKLVEWYSQVVEQYYE